MAKQGMARPERTHPREKNSAKPVPELQGAQKHAKQPAPPLVAGTDKVWHTRPEISNVASMSECTGLMQSIPRTEEEAESYRSLSSMEIPREPE